MILLNNVLAVQYISGLFISQQGTLYCMVKALQYSGEDPNNQETPL